MIIIDDRKETDTYEGLKKRGILDAEVQRIEVADVLLDDGVAVERKGHDLFGSLTTGRIWEQLNGLNEYEHPILCIVNENIWRDMYYIRSNWIHKSYQGFLTTLALRYPKLKVFQFGCMEDYLDFIVALDKKIHKEGKSTRPTPIHRKTKKIQVRMEDCLAMADGISIGKAKIPLKKYNTVYDVASQPLKELEKMDGYGKKLAKNLYDLLHGQYKEE